MGYFFECQLLLHSGWSVYTLPADCIIFWFLIEQESEFWLLPNVSATTVDRIRYVRMVIICSWKLINSCLGNSEFYHCCFLLLLILLIWFREILFPFVCITGDWFLATAVLFMEPEFGINWTGHFRMICFTCW